MSIRKRDRARKKPARLKQPSGAELPASINNVLLELTRLFVKKNAEYSDGARWNANFLDAAPVANGLMSPLMYCMTQAAKQDDAFWKAVNRSEGEIANITERLSDGTEYRIIALALLKEKK